MAWIKLVDLLKNVQVLKIIGQDNTYVSGITLDSRKVRPNCMFVACCGKTVNGNDFIQQALRSGASVIVTEQEHYVHPDVPFVIVPDARVALAQLTRNFYNDPSRSLRLVGITGTNGKTTVSYLIEHILLYNSVPSGLIGTIENRFGDYFCRSWMTTPDITYTNYILSRAVADGISAMVMEVSSHGIEQKRIECLDFDVAVFTNLSPEHLDYHSDFDEYCECKAELFESTQTNGKAGAVINIDDPMGEYILACSHGNTITYGVCNHADLVAQDIVFSVNGTSFTAIYREHNSVCIELPLLGIHNVYNALASIGAGIFLNITLNDMAVGLRSFKGVPGRLEKIQSNGQINIYVDYAHTSDALEQVLRTLKKVCTGKIIVVFGCGGNRDITKRKPMGLVVSRYATRAIITSDNPRKEDPLKIMDEISKGFSSRNYEIILDRKKAIATAISQASGTDVVLIAGKGHEKYQIIGDTWYPFDDVKVAEQILKNHNGVISG